MSILPLPHPISLRIDLWRLLLLPSSASAQTVCGSVVAPSIATGQGWTGAGGDPAGGQEQTEAGLYAPQEDLRVE